MALPNSTKVRRTKVALDWFYDPARDRWRFYPTDLAHRAEYDRTDGAGNPLQPARTTEIKGWIPATLAIQHTPKSRKSMPKVVRERYASLLPNAKESEGEAPDSGKAN